MAEMSDIGLVFGRGGAKGAYQIGVWNALRNSVFYKHIKAVSGTSVGALNAVLFALGDYDKAKRIWEEISPSDLVTPNIFPSISKSKKIYKHFLGENYFLDDSSLLSRNGLNIDNGLYLRDGLNKFIDSLDFEKLKYSKIDVYVGVNNITDKTQIEKILESLQFFSLDKVITPVITEGITEVLRLSNDCTLTYVHINSLPTDLIKSYLLASSAMPVAYKEETIKRGRYIDGGVTQYGNVPIQPLYSKGFRNIIVVPLDYKFDMKKIETKFRLDQLFDMKKKETIFSSSETVNAYNAYKGCDFIEIKPSKSLGQTMDFTKKSIEKRMILGKYDAYKILSDKRFNF